MATLAFNRTRKAMRFADVLTAAGCSAADLDHLGEQGWLDATRAAGYLPADVPSPATIEAIRAVLVERESAEDPFASFARDRST
jgi:hypothetical protein